MGCAKVPFLFKTYSAYILNAYACARALMIVPLLRRRSSTFSVRQRSGTLRLAVSAKVSARKAGFTADTLRTDAGAPGVWVQSTVACAFPQKVSTSR